ncbi:MAG: glycosyltransferase [Candidatus Dadabacteria bacterium]|nr:MAG: glycosyltransferase [Candidatus Dadabacteria bacterium]
MKPDISVVIPFFNEEAVVEELIERIIAVLAGLKRSYEIVAVNDGSSDSTGKILRRCFSAHPDVIIVIELARNYGQTAALAAGIDHARGDVVITMDGDLQHQPEEIPRFIAEIDKGYDLVNGWREVRRDNLIFRKIPSYLANLLMRKISGINVRDFGSTYKAYRGDLVRRLDLFGELHRFLPALAYMAGARITEIPISVKERTKGQSKYGLGRAFGVFQDIAFLDFFINYLTRPIRAFGKLFFIFFGVGSLISSVLMVLWALGYINRVLDHGALLLFSIFLMIVGVQFLVAGILAELLSRIYVRTSGKRIYAVREVLGPTE